MDYINSIVLSFIVFFPLVGAVAVFLSPNLKIAKILSMASAVITFFATLHVWHHFDPNTTGLQFVEQYWWIKQFGISYFLGVDGISLLLVVLTGFFLPLILLSVWHLDNPKQKHFLGLFLFLQSGMFGALLAFDMVLFYIFWELMLIPMYFIIGIWGGKNRLYATTKFVIYTVAGSLLMLVAAIVLYNINFVQNGIWSTSLLDLYKVKPDHETQMWLFAAFAVSFAIKVPVFPFHTWLADAHTEAPTAGSVILAGVLLKMGTYGLLRFAIPMFPEASLNFAPLIVALGIIGIIYGAFNAWMQKDAKKMIAYSSVSHLGFVVIGCFAFFVDGSAMVEEAVLGALYQMINHGISTGALFFLIGVIYERRHTRLLSEYGGLAKVMPVFALLLIVSTMSSVGLPGTGGFVGEFLILLGSFKARPIAGIIASLGVLFGAVYMLTLCRAILFGPITKEVNKDLKDVNKRELGYLVPLVFLAVFMGIFPNYFLDKVRSSVSHLSTNYANYTLKVDNHLATIPDTSQILLSKKGGK